MPTFQQRRDTILSQFAQAKADLETLNSDIDTEIEKNKSVISTLTSKNTELASLKSNNESSIKTFAKFLKTIIINPINNQLLPVWLGRYPGTIMPHLFSSLCKSSRVRCIRSTAVDTTKSLFVHIRMPLLWRQTNKWRNWKTLSFCGKNARIASRVR